MDSEIEQEVLHKMTQYQFKGKDLNDLVQKLKEILEYDHLLNVFYLDSADQGHAIDIDETILYSIIRAKSHFKGKESESKSEFIFRPKHSKIQPVKDYLLLKKYSSPS